MKEVSLHRVAGPFEQIPFANYIQSPIGLVPKVGTDKTRLIFHLSFQFKQEPHGSLNFHTPRDRCKVHYQDLDYAIKTFLDLVRSVNCSDFTKPTVYLGKTDAQSAFRILPLSVQSRFWTIMKAQDPISKLWKFFIDKCLPFGASISCALFQRFSNALKFLAEKRTHAEGTVTNYLDDFLFIALLLLVCNDQIQQFIAMCDEIGVPISHERTVWGSEFMIFLGMLLDGRNCTLSIPLDKKEWAIRLLREFAGKKKSTIKDLQVLCGYLNFLTRAITAGRTFLRQMYSKYSGHV